MKNSRVLATVMSTALTLITGCNRPSKPAEFKELVPGRAEELTKAAKESPFIIVVTIVTVDGEHRVFLNKEKVGTTEDVTLFKERLAQALERRKQAYRARAGNASPDAEEESNQKVVFVSATSSFKYGDIIKVVEAIKSVGGEPIGLQSENPGTDR